MIPDNPFRFALHCYCPHKKWAFGAILAVVTAMVLGRVNIWVIKQLTDSAVGFSRGDSLSDIWFWSLSFPGIYLINEFVWRSSGFCGMRWITGSVAEAYSNLFSYLTGHSASYFGDRFAGALTNKISNAARGIEQLTGQALWQFFPVTLGIVGDTYLLSTADASLCYLLLAWVSIYLVVNYLFVRRLGKLSYTHAEISSDLKGRIVDSASNIDTVQQAGEIGYERKYIDRFIGKQRGAHLTEWMYSEWLLVTNGLLLTVFMFLMIGRSIQLLESATISIGALVMVITIVMNLERNLCFIGQQATQAMSNFGQLSEGLAELLKPHEITNPSNPALLDNIRGEICFERMGFSYGESSIFRDFSLTIPPGQKVGVVGPSGAGKSTLVNLLLRQFDVNQGNVSVDGKPVAEFDLDQLRRSIALVPQTTSLFHRSIEDNIRYGRLSANDDEVVEAACMAQADDFIRKLSDGYSTYVGERGVKLSGGQRQRIAIARALLKNAPILILDEATSALDSASEEAIQRALEQLMKGKTVLAIAHRLSTLRSMDRIIVLHEGRIVEDGSHEELREENGLYASLWNSQVQGFIAG